MLGSLGVLEVDDTGIIGVSGGGRSACACATRSGARVTRTALVASTDPSDLDGVRATWRKPDRRLYGRAVRVPWLLRSHLVVMAHRIRSEPKRVPELSNGLPPPKTKPS
jgi:pimeloyl-ACP methyl ester carboxylesterase